MEFGARMVGRVKEDSGIDGRRLKMLAWRLRALSPLGAWWPYDDPFELAVSAVLTQQTRWEAVESAMEGLRAAGLLTPGTLALAARGRVEKLVRPTGFYRQKTRAIQGIAAILVERFGGQIENAFALPTRELRAELLSWPGVGDETADAILLFGAKRPAFVVDAYTRRLMGRYGATRAGRRPTYAQVSAACARAVGRDSEDFQRAHAAIVELCKSHCTRVPLCGGCPLAPTCPRVGVAPAGAVAIT